MYTLSSLGVDVSLFWDYWYQLKDKINYILNFGSYLWEIKDRYDDLYQRALAIGETSLAKEAEEGSLRVNGLFDLWNSIRAKINEWLPSWIRAEEESSVEAMSQPKTEGFGIIPLAVWAIGMLIAGGMAALTYVVTNWQKLEKEYESEKLLLQKVEQGVITAEQAKEIMGVQQAGAPDIFQKIGNIGTLFLIGVGGLIVYNFVVSGRKK